MMSQKPADFTKVDPTRLNQEILRLAIMSELDAINLYEQMAALATDDDLRRVLLDIAREEKTHMGEFHVMLMRCDPEQVQEMVRAHAEVKGITGK